MAYNIRTVTSAADLDCCGRIRADVYCHERNIVPLQQLEGDKELDQYDFDGSAISFLGFDQRGAAVGTARLIVGSRVTALPIEKHFCVDVANRDRCGEFSRFAVHKAHRGAGNAHLLMLGLIRAVYDYSLPLLTDVYAIVEPKLLEFITFLGFPFEQLAPPRTCPTIRTKPCLRLCAWATFSRPCSSVRTTHRSPYLAPFGLEPFLLRPLVEPWHPTTSCEHGSQ